MRVVFRADAGVAEGTGHVMRCLTLAEELLRRGHEVHFVTQPIPIPWLNRVVAGSGVIVHVAESRAVSVEQISGLQPDWLVVDSYEIPSADISSANEVIRVLAIVDGDDRGIDATLYLDQNLGAEERLTSRDERFLCGSRFALVRQAIVRARRNEPWNVETPKKVVCFMGGTDPFGGIVSVAGSIAHLERDIDLTVVAPDHLHSAVRSAVSQTTRLTLLPLTPSLPSLLAGADIVVSAAGTSAWDICTLGIPAVLVAVVENQRTSFRAATSRGVAIGVNAIDKGTAALSNVGPMVEALLDDRELRRRVSDAALETFDGEGAGRVAARLESRINRFL